MQQETLFYKKVKHMIPTTIRGKLPKILVDAMDELNSSCNSTDEATFNLLLGAMNTPIQAITNIEPVISPNDWKKTPLTLWLMTFMPSGAKKSHIGGIANTGGKEYQKTDKVRYDDELKRYRIDKKDYEDALKSKTATSFPAEPVHPLSFRSNYSTATTNGIKLALKYKPYVGFHNYDALEFFSGHSWQEKNGGGSEVASMLSNAWSGETIENQTGVEENNVYLPNRRINLNLAMQAKVADIYNNKKLRRQGFLNRFLTVQAHALPPITLTKAEVLRKKTLSGVRTSLDIFADRLIALYNEADNLQIYNHSLFINLEKYDRYELIVDTMTFEADGSDDLLIDFYNKCQSLASNPDNEDYVEFIVRLYEQACRLIGNLTKIEGLVKANKQFTECGIGLSEWYLGQLMELTGIGMRDDNPIVSDADEIYKAFIKDLPAGTVIIKRDFYKHCQTLWKRLPVDAREKIINQMVSNDWVKFNDAGKLERL